MVNEDKKNAALRCIDEAPVRARQAWQHRRTGGTYTVVAVGLDEALLEPTVIYVGHDGIVWVRALAVFLGTLDDGTPRFVQLDDDGQPRQRSFVCTHPAEVRP